MTFAEGLSSYLSLNILIAVGFLIVWSSRFIFKVLHHPPDFCLELKLHYFVLLMAIILILCLPIFPRAQIFEPAAKIWTSGSLKNFQNTHLDASAGGFLNIPTTAGPLSVETHQISFILLSFLLLIVFLGGLRIFLDLYSLYKIKSRSYLVRRVGRVSVYLNDAIKVPFSYWTPFKANLVIPSGLISNAVDYRIAIHHELQHHRQKDTQWVYVIWILKSLCILNPFIHLWGREIAELQEFACDEALVTREKVSSWQYVRCLVEVAKNASHQKPNSACATGLTFLVERNLLKRRVEKMISNHSFKKNPITVLLQCAVAGLGVLLMASSVYASKGLIQDRRVSEADAQSMLKNIKPNPDFPLVINDLVLKELNRYLGTPEGREHMKSSLQRMQEHKKFIAEKLQEYNVPADLIAIPIIESGYQNLEQSSKAHWGAGIWMFIASTAKHFGLEVSSKKDDRLNVSLETDAAMRLLKANHLRYQDWQLSVLAYNMGETAVQKAMEKTKSRDAWTIIRKGFEKDPNYLPQLVAAILIMKNPKSLD